MKRPLVASRKDPAVLLRVPRGVLKKVDHAAGQSGRSRNSEILHLVTQGLSQQPAPPAAS